MDEPRELINSAANDMVPELDELPFLCVTCGGRFDNLEDAIFHILTEHEPIMCMMSDKRLISYNEFLELLSKKMIETVYGNL